MQIPWVPWMKVTLQRGAATWSETPETWGRPSIDHPTQRTDRYGTPTHQVHRVTLVMYPIQTNDRKVWQNVEETMAECDILLYLLDARHPLVSFHPGLYQRATTHHGCKVIFVLTKVSVN